MKVMRLWALAVPNSAHSDWKGAEYCVEFERFGVNQSAFSFLNLFKAFLRGWKPRGTKASGELFEHFSGLSNIFPVSSNIFPVLSTGSNACCSR